MKMKLLVLFWLFLGGFVSMNSTSDEFRIIIIREKINEGLIIGKIFVNDSLLGKTYENEKLKIPAGFYKGFLRYISDKKNVQGPLGTLSNVGDFYLEVGDVEEPDGKKRINILFHAGNKPEHSQGCILLGAVNKDIKTGTRHLDDGHPLRRLRLLFYGTDFPVSSPNRSISIEISERKN